LGALGQGVHEVPQVCGSVFDTHWPEHSWVPLLQVTPHWMPSQVGVVLASDGQGVHEVPQVSVLLLDTH
jgi:hypothetical protein